MPKCINNSKKSYKGTEPSPKGLGYCASEEEVNTKKKGRDNNYWIVKETKNKTKRWVKETKTTKTTKKTKQTKLTKQTKQTKKKGIYSNLTDEQLETIYKLTKTLRKELKKINVNVYISKLKNINGVYYKDLIHTDKEVEPYLIIVLKLNKDKTLNTITNEINIHHSGIKNDITNQVDTLLKNMFKNNYNWNKKQTSTINIKL